MLLAENVGAPPVGLRKSLIRIVGRGLTVLGLVAMAGQGATAATLRVATTALPASLANPYRFTNVPHIFTFAAVFDGLTRIDAEGVVQPWLAVSWTRRDATTWRFSLRPNVRFSNGAPFNADAVVNTVAYLAGPGHDRELIAREVGIKSARKIDDLTVELTAEAPAPFLPRVLPYLYIVEPGAWRSLGPEGFARAPVGTGPFRVTRIAANRWDLAAVPTSWRAPQVEALSFIAAADAGARAQAVLADQADIALQIGPGEVGTVEAGGGRGASWPLAAVWGIHFHIANGKHAALKDRRVREALNLAVDRDTIVAQLLQGGTVPARGPGPRRAFGYDPSLPPIPYDPARAKKLLTEAGYPNGFRFVLQAVIGSAPADGEVYQKVAEDLSRIGVTMETRTFPVPQLIRSVVEGTWDGDAFGLAISTEPSIDVMRPMIQFSCLNPHAWYCDQSVMPLIREAFVESDPKKALDLRHRLMAHYRNDYPSLYLYDQIRFVGLRANVRDFAEVNGFIAFERIKLDK